MEIATYAAEAPIERDHWWFVGRRRLFASLIGEFDLAGDAEILDVGTSTGTNLRMLRDLGFQRVTGVDSSRAAIAFCAEKGLGQVHLGDVCNLPFPDARFDLVLATDIIEHVADDVAALRELRRVLRPGRPLLLTVPAFQCLWGLQDDVSHHLRRYRLGQVLRRLRQAGLTPARGFYFNYLLFVPILLARRLMKVVPTSVASEGEINTRLLNRILTRLFRLDVRTAPWLQPPFGVSALVVATRP
jgi:SAM-dependent methyltransferase